MEGSSVSSRLLRKHSSFISNPGSPIPPRKQKALLRRTSSFGGGPIVVVETQTLVGSPAHKEDSQLRWIILLLACLLLFGNYYAYDNPAALNKPLVTHF